MGMEIGHLEEHVWPVAGPRRKVESDYIGSQHGTSVARISSNQRIEERRTLIDQT